MFCISLCLYFFTRFKCVIELADVSRALGLQVTRSTNSCLLHWRCQQPLPIFSLRNLIGFTGHNPWIDAPCIHASNKNYIEACSSVVLVGFVLSMCSRFEPLHVRLLLLWCLTCLLGLQDVLWVWELVVVRVSWPGHPGFSKKKQKKQQKLQLSNFKGCSSLVRF